MRTQNNQAAAVPALPENKITKRTQNPKRLNAGDFPPIVPTTGFSQLADQRTVDWFGLCMMNY